jgi:hypothetical protein
MSSSEWKYNQWYFGAIRSFLRLAHHFNWHYAPPIYPEGDTVLWCKWCGLRQVVKQRTRTIAELEEILNNPNQPNVVLQPDGSVRAE